MTQPIVTQLEAELANIDMQLATLQERREGIQKVLATYSGQLKPLDTPAQRADLPTIEMARQVVATKGMPMGTAEIRRAIQHTFGIMPASSLQQMLYIRAKQDKVFFNENKKYGLLAWRRKK